MPVVHQTPPTRLTEAVVEHVEHFRWRVVQDALIDATADYWQRRAAEFEWARPRPGDYAGRATIDDLRAADERCRLAAEACRLRSTASVIKGAA